MIIAIIVRYYPPTKHMGGIAVSTNNIVNTLSSLDLNNEIHVITTSEYGKEILEKKDNVFVHRVITRINYGLLDGVEFLLRATACLKSIRPDVVHIQALEHALPGYLYFKISHTPYCIYGRGSDIHLDWPCKQILAPIYIKNASKVIALSTLMAKSMYDQWKYRSIIIPNGVDISGISELTPKTYNRPTIITVCSLVAVKGLSYALNSLVDIKKIHSDILYVIVGDGPEKEKLECQVIKNNLHDNVIFTGAIQNREVPNYLVSANIYLQPSLSEGFSVSVIEAMACGLPLVVTSVGAAVDIMDNGINGYLIKPATPGEITDKICHLLSHPSLCKKISGNNFNKAKLYSWETVAMALMGVYNDMYHDKSSILSDLRGVQKS